MSPLICAALAAAALLIASPSLAGERTVKLAVENVSCATCAPIIKRTLARIPGVNRVTVAELAGAATATVRFDDGRVTAEALTAAVTNAGFPARVQKN